MAAQYGVTDQGFALKRLADILSDMRAALSTVVDPETGEQLTPDLLDENDPLIQMVNAFSDSLALGWEQLQLAYNQFDPLKATGAGLRGTVQLNGIRAKSGTPSTVAVTLTGTAGKTVPAGQRISDLDGEKIFTLPQFTFDGNGSATAIATCIAVGPIGAGANTITRILTPYDGWLGVINPQAITTTLGTAAETDSELRTRQQYSTQVLSVTLIEGVYGAIRALEGVEYCRVYQNITLETDVRGIPAKAICAVVQGGTSEAIAEELWQKASAFELYGSTEVTRTDAQGINYTMRFQRPTEVPVHIAITLSVINATLWPSNGPDLIKAQILAYAQGGAGALGVPAGWDRDGWVVGESVYASELYTPVNSIPGVAITALAVGTAPEPAAASVMIEWDEVATFDSANITVTVN